MFTHIYELFTRMADDDNVIDQVTLFEEENNSLIQTYIALCE